MSSSHILVFALFLGACHSRGADSASDVERSLGMLVVNDPYTRSAFQLPIAMQAVVASIDTKHVDASARADWTRMRQQLDEHVALLDSLGADLRIPIVGDALYGAPDGVLVDRERLAASADPLAATRPLLLAVTDLAREIDGPLHARIDLESRKVEEETGIERACPRGPWAVMPGQPWTAWEHLRDEHALLKNLEPQVQDPFVAGRIEVMLELMDTYAANQHAHVGTQIP